MSKKTKPQFLLISKEKESATEILGTLSEQKHYEVRIADTLHEAMEIMSQNYIQCVIFDLPTFSLKSIKFISKLREMYKAPPFMVISSKIQKEAFDSASKIAKVVLLERTFMHEELTGICSKVVQGKSIHQRKFKRFATDQIVEIERMVSGEVLKGFAYNLSQGGAYISIENSIIVPGDILRMSIQLEKVGRTHTVFAKVVWVVQNQIKKLNPSVGVKFVPAEYVYSSLLETFR